jgi:hypothetical protein
MEMLETVALPDLATAKDGPCWFCEEKPTSQVTNDEDESPTSPEGSAESAENGESNDASKLGANLGSRPKWTIGHKVGAGDPIQDGSQTEIVPAAHHLLPGNASVNKAAALHKYMLWKGKNPLQLIGPIGYDINAAANGVWLPGNYAVRKETDFNKNWGDFADPFKEAYARAAMKSAGDLQLHDAHPAYNSNVLRTLIDVAKKLDELWEDRSACPVCKRKLENHNTPPYGLVSRLNRLSGEHKKALIFTRENKKAISNGYYTSSRVLTVYL